MQKLPSTYHTAKEKKAMKAIKDVFKLRGFVIARVYSILNDIRLDAELLKDTSGLCVKYNKRRKVFLRCFLGDGGYYEEKVLINN